MADNFSVSKDSVQLPYRRFLADSAAGLSLMLLVVASYYLPIVSNDPLRKTWLAYSASLGPHGIGTETRVFVLFVLFLLATPIGFAVNALSWLLIDYPICGFERLYFRWSRKDGRIFPLWDVTEARFGATLDVYFNLTERNFNLAAWFFRDVLEAYVPDRFETQTHIKGLVVFLRNLTLFALALAFVSLANAVGKTPWLIGVIAAAIGTVVLLVCRWSADHPSAAKRRKVFNGAFVLITLAGFVVATLGVASTMWYWYVRAVALFSGAAITIAIIAMVEYYYHDAILLHAYFACQEHEVAPAGEAGAGNERILMIARELIRKIGEESRKAGGRSSPATPARRSSRPVV